ncbi:MAG: TolC family protein [Pseudomonadota bacterium]|nr:TolC family protein [Pseudomonadota bacterium]
MSVQTYFYRILILLISPFCMAYTLSLNDAFHKALKNDLSIQEARLTWLANKNDKGIALSYLLPQLDFNYNNTKNKNTLKHCTDACEKIKKSYREGQTLFSLSQELFNMQTYYQYSKANQKALQDLFIYQKALQDLTLRIATQYFDLILSIENHDFLKAELQETQKRENDVRMQASLGAMTKAQLLEVTAQTKRIQANIIQAKMAIYNAKDILSDSIGCDQFTKIKKLRKKNHLMHIGLPNLTHWLTDAMQKNLDIKIADNGVTQANFQKKAMTSQYLPTVQINSSYNDYRYENQSISNTSNNLTASPQKNNHNTQAGISLSFPIINGGKRYYDQNKAQKNLQLSHVQKQNTQQSVIREIKKLHRQLEHNQEIINAKTAALNSSQEMLRITRISLKAGAVTVLETLENISNVRKDHQSLENIKYNHILNLIEILIQTGNISPQEIKQLNADLQETIPITPL